MELSELPEPAPRADAGTDALAPIQPLDHAEDTPTPPFMGSLGIQAPPSPDAIDNARRGTWVMNDYLDGWMLMGANGRPVMRADGSRVAFWFRDIDRLAREWAPAEGSQSPTTKRRAGLAAIDSGFGSDWDPATGQAYRADVKKAMRLLAYNNVQSTEPEEAVRRATAMVLGDPVTVREGNIDAFMPKRFNLVAAKAVANAMRTDLVGAEPVAEVGQERSQSDEIADVYRVAGERLRHGRSTGGGTSIFDLIVDIEKGALAGARDAAQEALEGIDTLAGLMGMNPELSKHLALPEAWETETAGGAAARSISQFLVGFIPAFKTIKIVSGGAALTKIGKLAQAEGAAAAASATVFDPLEERLSNTWQELGLPQNILTDYLAASPDDSEVEGRLKNAIESLAIGSGLAGGLATSAQILRAARRAMTPSALVAGGAATAAGLAVEDEPTLEIEPDEEAGSTDLQGSESDSLLSPYAGGAASAFAFAGSNLSVKPQAMREAWQFEWRLPWPVNEKGKNQQVHHLIALRDKGKNVVENIYPLTHDEHVWVHKEQGDHRRWRLEDLAKEKAKEKEVKKATGRASKTVKAAVAKVITRGKSKTR